MFIYKITNSKNGKMYIGQTIRPIEQRFKRHINDAMNNILDTHFARAIRKYGESCFQIELIDTAKTQDELNLKEQKYIQLYNSVKCGYNETDALYKCGGNTYKSKTSEELKVISDKIRNTKVGDKNPNHSSVKVRNEETKEEIVFKTVSDCKKFFKEPHHRFITNRVTGKTKSLYKGLWNIAYTENEFSEMTKSVEQKRCFVQVTNIESKKIEYFTSVRKMCEALGLKRGKIRNGKDICIDGYQIEFR